MLMLVSLLLKRNSEISHSKIAALYQSNDKFHQIPGVERQDRELNCLPQMNPFVIDQIPVLQKLSLAQKDKGIDGHCMSLSQ